MTKSPTFKKKNQKSSLQTASFNTLSSRITVILLLLITITGCANLETSSTSEPIPAPITHDEFLQLQQRISQLEKTIQEKNTIILKQRTHQQHQVEAQQNTSNETTRVRLKLHRLATKPSAASTIAEVEVAMKNLKQNQITAANQALQTQAQYLLDTATRFYTLDAFASSMNYAAQAYEMINMTADQNRNAPASNQLIVTFQVPVMLRTKTGVNLREGANKNTAIRSTLEEDTALIANAYQGNWLRVQTEDGTQGWVLNTLVETTVSKKSSAPSN